MNPLPRQDRAHLYALCAGLLTREVDGALASALRAEVDAWVEIEPELAGWLDAVDDAALAALRSEYARLFLLPKGVSPQASAWLDAGAGGAADRIATDVHRAMEALGLEQSAAAGRLPLDHLALVLRVLAEGLGEDDPRGVAIAEALERSALASGDWVERFGEALASHTSEPLYRALGNLTVALARGLHGSSDGNVADPSGP